MAWRCLTHRWRHKTFVLQIWRLVRHVCWNISSTKACTLTRIYSFPARTLFKAVFCWRVISWPKAITQISKRTEQVKRKEPTASAFSLTGKGSASGRKHDLFRRSVYCRWIVWGRAFKEKPWGEHQHFYPLSLSLSLYPSIQLSLSLSVSPPEPQWEIRVTLHYPSSRSPGDIYSIYRLFTHCSSIHYPHSPPKHCYWHRTRSLHSFNCWSV